MRRAGRGGFSLIDLILAIGIIATLFGGIFLVYFAIVDTAVNYELRRAASSILQQRVETVRSLAYEQVGVVGGIPAGSLPQSEQVIWDGTTFSVSAFVRSVDDPFDGTVTSTPQDTAPADYKLVEFSIACVTCPRFTPIAVTTTVAPQGLESASANGSLFVSVFDADGAPVPGAQVTVENASTSPAIDFSDVTNAAGMLQLVDVPTSTQAYAVTVGKDGYSSEQTYPVGGPGNPNPDKPHATVGSQAVTELSFSIDRLGTIALASSDARCQPVGGAPYEVIGSKLIGTAPDVVKNGFFGTTSGGGASTLPGIEWDTYAVTYGGSLDLAGTVPLAPLAVAPGATQPLRLVLAQPDGPSLLVLARDASTGGPVEARIALTGAGSAAATTSQAIYAEDGWPSAASFDAVAGVTVDGTVTLAPAGGPYPTSTAGTAESLTVDLGAGAVPLVLDWDGDASGAGPDALRFQVATSDADGASWSYRGPDGTAGTYFDEPGAIHASQQGRRYLRYRAYLQTDSSSATPELAGISLVFAGPCVPPGQRLFPGLQTGSYTVTATAPGYLPASAPASVGSGWQSVTLTLTPS